MRSDYGRRNRSVSYMRKSRKYKYDESYRSKSTMLTKKSTTQANHRRKKKGLKLT